MSTEARAELTLRGVVLGVLITLVFTAANVYFGLKAGLTFATSIPAAVISMALLRARQAASTLQENNIVQTVASAAGTLSSIIFVLPGLVMIGWWSGFPYWHLRSSSARWAACSACMYSIPLRRALVTTVRPALPRRASPAPKCSRWAAGAHGTGIGGEPRRTARRCCGARIVSGTLLGGHRPTRLLRGGRGAQLPRRQRRQRGFELFDCQLSLLCWRRPPGRPVGGTSPWSSAR